MQRIKEDTRGISNVIVVVLGLVIVIAIVVNIFLWNYEMNQYDWEKMKEDVEITDVARVTSSPWFVAQSEYTVNIGSRVSGTYTDTQATDNQYERFRENTGGGSQPVVGWFRYAPPSPPVSTTGDNEAILDTQGPGGGDKKEMTIKSISPNGYFYNTTGVMFYSAGEWAIKLFRNVAEGPSVTFDVYIETTSEDGLTVINTVKFWDDLVCTDSALTQAWLNYTATSSYSTNSSTRLRVRFVWQSGATLKIYYNGADGEGYASRIIVPTGGLNSELDMNGSFVIDVSTYPLAYVQTVEIQLRYMANDTGEKWYLKAYNWSSSTYSDSGFNSTAGHTPTTGWDYYTVNLTDQWGSYVQENGTVYVKVVDEGGDSNSTAIDIDFLAVRVIIDGINFTFENKGSLTIHLVSLWVNNSTHHQRYDMNIFINSGDTSSYIRNDISLPNKPYTVKVVTERGNIAIYSES